MWLQRFTNYLLKNRWQALILTFASTFVPVFGVLGILIAALVTLTKGVIEGALFTLVATLPYFVSFVYTGNYQKELPIVVVAAIGVAVFSNILTWIFAVMLRRQASWRLILELAALFGVLVVSVIHLAYPDVADWWGKELSTYYAQAQAMAKSVKPVTASQSEAQLETINFTKNYATGLIIAAILFNAVIQLVVARWWQGVVFKSVSLRRELHHIRLSYLAGVLFFVSFVLQYFGNSVILDIMPIVYCLFTAAGLSVVHYMFGFVKSPTAWLWLTMVYVMLIFALPASLVMLSMLAMFDSWFDLRKRFRKILKY